MISIADIIRLSWQTYISKFKKYLPLLGLIFLFSLVGSVATYYLLDILKLPQIWGLVASAGISAIVYLLTFSITILLILYTDQFLQNKKAEFHCKDVLEVFLPALLLSILVGLITAGGFLLLIIPGVLFTVWYAFTVYIAILEKKKGLILLSESRELSRGKFWPVFGRLILPNLFWGLISYFVLAGIFNIIGLIVNKAVVNQTELGFGVNVGLLAVSALVASFFAPLYVIVTTIVFREVKK
ncbi:hypothetical protein KJ885_04445 [Patescibacteria group bacterium]|nr:hypothetical protein [Patescibacteria group bacterium]